MRVIVTARDGYDVVSEWNASWYVQVGMACDQGLDSPFDNETRKRFPCALGITKTRHVLLEMSLQIGMPVCCCVQGVRNATGICDCGFGSGT